jgi:hypothetical protein
VTDQTIEDATAPTGYAATAAELERIAAALRDLPGKQPFVTLYINPGPTGTDEEKAAAVDAAAIAVLGKPGKPERVGGSWHHTADHWAGLVTLSVHAAISGPPDERADTIAELRAELAQVELERGQARGTA